LDQNIAILRHCISKRPNSNQFFRDYVAVAQKESYFDFFKLKAYFMKKYAGTYWKSTALKRLFALGYNPSVNVKTFMDRFCAAAHQADIGG
jgi:hypothetical protein